MNTIYSLIYFVYTFGPLCVHVLAVVFINWNTFILLNTIASIPWAVRLLWLQNAYSRPFLVGDFDPQSRSDWLSFRCVIRVY